MAVSLTIGIAQNSQSVANNTSNVTVTVTASWSYGSYNQLQKPGYLIIDGTKYEFTSSFNYNATTSGSQTIFTKTVNVGHNSDGTKVLSCSASYTTGVSSGTISASAQKTLTTIPRESTLSASDGTLGTAQTLTVTKQSSSFTHTITYKCGNAVGIVCTKSTSTSISFTPPLVLAKQNTTGTRVQITFTVKTFSGETSVGTSSKSIYCAIPLSVSPTVSFSVSDAMGYRETYGAYIQGNSKLSISIDAAGAYGSTIVSCSTTVDGKKYNSNPVKTDVIAGSGTQTIIVTATDTRGHTKLVQKTISVLEYHRPKITSYTVERCNSDGTLNRSGTHLRATFSASVSGLDDQNTAAYSIKQSKVSTPNTSVTTNLADYDNVYSVADGVFVFAADTASSYHVRLAVADNFYQTELTAVGPSISVLLSVLNGGNGIAFGKVAEKEGGAEFNFDLYDKYGASIGNGLSAGNSDGTTDPDTTLEPLIWTSKNTPMSGYPMFVRTSFFGAKSITADRAQTAIPADELGSMYHRYYKSDTGAWSDWRRHVNEDEILSKIYPVGSIYLSVSSANPSTFIGGTWERFGTGRTLVGVDTSQTEFKTVKKTGGAKTHTLTTDQIPSHTHNQVVTIASDTGTFSSNTDCGDYASKARSVAQGATTDETGGGGAHNNLQPYITCYMWVRTA